MKYPGTRTCSNDCSIELTKKNARARYHRNRPDGRHNSGKVKEKKLDGWGTAHLNKYLSWKHETDT